MKLIITIDTEEDNWDRYSATDNPVSNIDRIPALQSLFDEFGVRPTYLVTYPVAANPRSVEILKRILDEGKCEIGTHCHPWNTPPFDEKCAITEWDTMLCNLPEEIVHQKLTVLHDTICKNFEIVPVSFRSGRFGFSPAVADSLCRLGYLADTSVTPFINWQSSHGPDYFNFGPEPFRFGPAGLSRNNKKGPLLEVPVTIGFHQTNFHLCRFLIRATGHRLSARINLRGILFCLRLLNQFWLSPEVADADAMIRLARRMEKNKYPALNLTFHSTSLKNGLSPFVKSHADENQFFDKIRSFLDHARNAGWESVTLAEFEKTTKTPPSVPDH